MSSTHFFLMAAKEESYKVKKISAAENSSYFIKEKNASDIGWKIYRVSMKTFPEFSEFGFGSEKLSKN